MKSALQLMCFRHFSAFFLLLLIFCAATAQTHTPRYQAITASIGGFYEYLPQGYSTETQSYPLIIFIHGIGELGNGSPSMLPTVLYNGIPRVINDGKFPVSFKVNGETFKFIVLSPQFGNWPTPADVQGVIDFAVKKYRVNTSRIYLSGLSMGGGGVWDYAGASLSNANRVAAIVPVCGSSNPLLERCNVMATANLPIWATHNLLDPTVASSNTIGYVDQITTLSALLRPLGEVKQTVGKTIFPVEGHDAWTTSYSPSFKENGKNIYEWMLQFQRGTSTAPAPAPNQSPVSNAGADLNITLPTNSVNLSGSGSDPDGTITNYSWTKIAGPSQFTINNGNIPNPTLSNLVEGDYTLRLTVTDNSGATAFNDVNIKVNAAAVTQPPVSGGTFAIPGKIEAENFLKMFGVMNEKTSDEGGGLNVGWIEMGDWMDYKVNVASAGTYTVNFRVASPFAGLQLQLKNDDGVVLTTVNVPQTNGFQIWKTVTATVNLTEGSQTLKIYSVQNGWLNINWLEFTLILQAAPIINPTTATIPGKIEAENYNAMYGVLAEHTIDINGGFDVGWIEMNDWMDYNVNVASAGNYTVNLRVASPYSGQKLQLKNSDGSILATFSVPLTGGFQIWKTISATVNLKAGAQTLRVYSTQDGWLNINWLEFVRAASSNYSAIPGKIESESFSTSFGIITEPTIDVGGGWDVGWIELGDWFEYKVNVAASGNYNVNLRVASPFHGQQLQVKNASGTVLATADIPFTGAFQTWRTVNVPLYLFSGLQTIRIYSAQNGWWNINWMEFSAGSLNSLESTPVEVNGTLSGTEASAIAENNVVTRQKFSIYPNPVKNRFELQIANQYTGATDVQIVNQAGAIVKRFKVVKTLPVLLENLPVTGLPAGTYIIKVQIGTWSDTRKLLKL
ncbi:MAG: carbohydrate-binding protein [Chitinophagaceae bacterium]